MIYQVKLVFEQTVYAEADDANEAQELVERHVFSDENGAFDPQVERASIIEVDQLPATEFDSDVIRQEAQSNDWTESDLARAWSPNEGSK